jgi:hypothetical protein
VLEMKKAWDYVPGEPLTGLLYAFLLRATFAQRARCAAAIFLLVSADITRFTRLEPPPCDEACLAHLAFCARLIFRRAAAETW